MAHNQEVAGSNPARRTNNVDMERFFSKVNKTERCWEWTAALRNGYGAFKINKKIYSAHRVSWELANGKIPANLFVCHKCDNPKCVNPDHLFLGTRSDNMKDAFKKGRLNLEYARDMQRLLKASKLQTV